MRSLGFGGADIHCAFDYKSAMSYRQRYGLSRVINARGTFTPLGVSRSPDAVGEAVAEALSDFFVIEELQGVASRQIADWSGAEAGTVVHCVAAAITVAVAAVMTGESQESVAALPDTAGMRNRVVLPACHAMNYGHPIEQAVRLAGAIPVLAGEPDNCLCSDIEEAISHPDTACVLLVSSRLVRGGPMDFDAIVAAAHRRQVPVIIDGAAQDMRIEQMAATGADMILVSAQKYLAAPTAGLVAGRADFIRAVRAQDKGIGRGMKASKEAILGVLAALAERDEWNPESWSEEQGRKVSRFLEAAGQLNGVTAHSVPDPTGLGFERAHLRIDDALSKRDARCLVEDLKSGDPSILVMDHRLGEHELVFELVQLYEAEIDSILNRLAGLLS